MRVLPRHLLVSSVEASGCFQDLMTDLLEQEFRREQNNKVEASSRSWREGPEGRRGQMESTGHVR